MYLCDKKGVREHYVDWTLVHHFIMEFLERNYLKLEFIFYALIYLNTYGAHNIIHSAILSLFSSLYFPVSSASVDTME